MQAAAQPLPITGIRVDAAKGTIEVATAEFATQRSASGLVGGRVTQTPERFHTFRVPATGGAGVPLASAVAAAQAEPWMNSLAQGALCKADDPCCIGQRFAAGQPFATVDQGNGSAAVTAATVYLAASGTAVHLAASSGSLHGKPAPPTARAAPGKSARDETAAFEARLAEFARSQFDRLERVLNAPTPPAAWPALAAESATPPRHCPRAWIGWAGSLGNGYATLEIRAADDIHLSVDFTPDRMAKTAAKRFDCRAAGRLAALFQDRCRTR